MNETRGGRGPNRGLLLLIPAALILAKAAKHRRQAMWESAERRSRQQPAADMVITGGSAHRGWSDGGDGFRLPPRIESALDAWHDRAHQEPASPETQTV